MRHRVFSQVPVGVHFVEAYSQGAFRRAMLGPRVNARCCQTPLYRGCAILFLADCVRVNTGTVLVFRKAKWKLGQSSTGLRFCRRELSLSQISRHAVWGDGLEFSV